MCLNHWRFNMTIYVWIAAVGTVCALLRAAIALWENEGEVAFWAFLVAVNSFALARA